jgi:hypothetical protein
MLSWAQFIEPRAPAVRCRKGAKARTARGVLEEQPARRDSEPVCDFSRLVVGLERDDIRESQTSCQGWHGDMADIVDQQ